MGLEKVEREGGGVGGGATPQGGGCKCVENMNERWQRKNMVTGGEPIPT
jgi:hypothetical protein